MLQSLRINECVHRDEADCNLELRTENLPLDPSSGPSIEHWHWEWPLGLIDAIDVGEVVCAASVA